MRSSSGAHFIALDHVRALAAFMVFAWHFLHSGNGYPVPFHYVPTVFPLSVFDEGHTGVALFMTLSGYLFAKLLDGKEIDYTAFIWNRLLRLMPLLIAVIGFVGLREYMRGDSLAAYAGTVVRGVILPTLPNGGWSITIEFHFYLILPILLWMLRRSRLLPVTLIVAAIALRLVLHRQLGEVQSLAYWTLVGRIDQFALGMLLFQFRSFIRGRHFVAIGVMTAFTLFYAYFDLCGGFYYLPSYPSPSLMWIFLPTLEGVGYGVAIAWYETSFEHSTNGFSRLLGHVGEYSYSIYLLHFFIVLRAARFVHEHVMDISNFYLALAWALGGFLVMLPIGYLSFRFIESPFLTLRKAYVLAPRVESVA